MDFPVQLVRSSLHQSTSASLHRKRSTGPSQANMVAKGPARGLSCKQTPSAPLPRSTRNANAPHPASPSSILQAPYSGPATFRPSTSPVPGSRISSQLIASSVAPVLAETAKRTPRALEAVERKSALVNELRPERKTREKAHRSENRPRRSTAGGQLSFLGRKKGRTTLARTTSPGLKQPQILTVSFAVIRTSWLLITPTKSGRQGRPSTVRRERVAAWRVMRVMVPITCGGGGEERKRRRGRDARSSWARGSLARRPCLVR